MAFNGIVSWVFLPFFLSWLKYVCQNPIKWVQETENDSRACRWNWSTWEANISSSGPKGMNSKWVLLFLWFWLFIYLFPSHYLKKKKCNSILGFHDEWVWVFMASKLFKYIFSFSKLIWVWHLIMFVINSFMVSLLYAARLLLSICLL